LQQRLQGDASLLFSAQPGLNRYCIIAVVIVVLVVLVVVVVVVVVVIIIIIVNL